jgi:hypothetical protein
VVALLVENPRITTPGPYPLPAPVLPFPDARGGVRRPSSAVLRRRRLLAAALLTVLVAAAWFGLQAALGRIGGSPLATAGAPGGPEPAAGRLWIVRPGDTLWSIAVALDPRGDVRPLVDRLDAEVGGTLLYPGESIAIPTG